MSAFIGEMSFKPVGEFGSEEIYIGGFKYGRVFPASVGGYLAYAPESYGAMSVHAASKDSAALKLVGRIERGESMSYLSEAV